MKNVYSYAKLIVMQKKDSHMVHDDIREEYHQSPIHMWWKHQKLLLSEMEYKLLK